MSTLENAILTWYAQQQGSSIPGLVEQLSAVRIGEREFTGGGGAFLTLEVDPGIVIAHPITLGTGIFALDGPEIRSPELQSGALTTLHIARHGALGSIEIWCYSNDYPTGQHPSEFVLIEAQGNYVDLRSTR
jgi:hypothetical protein